MNSKPHLSDNAERLADLYNRTSKHGQYQLVATPLRDILSSVQLRMHSRYEIERLAFILRNIPLQGSSIADIGGNTGFFSLELLDLGAERMLYIEGNQNHAEFVNEAARILGWQDRMTVLQRYLEFNADLIGIDVDVCLLLNVLHHISDDFGNNDTSIETAKNSIHKILTKLSHHTRFLVLQFGFNWKGNIELPLFRSGTKAEMVDFVRELTKGIWHIRNIGIAERTGTGVVYQNLTSGNLQRDDSLGEFLNRPLFIMEACKS